MSNYKSGSHTKYDIKYHIVWVTKYRKMFLTGQVADRARELIRQICLSNELTIIKGHVSKDHIHILVSASPSISVSKIVQKLKGATSHKLFEEFAFLKQKYWEQHLWSRGYFVATTGAVTEQIIAEYIENQDVNTPDDDFTISSDVF